METNNVRPFKFFESEECPIDLQAAVYQAIGAASVCWDDLSWAGEFRSDEALEIGRALIEKIKEIYE